MAKLENTPRNTVKKAEKKPIKIRKEILYSGIAAMAVLLLIAVLWSMRSSEYDKLIEQYRINNLVKDQYYDEAINLLDDFIQSAEHEEIREALIAKKEEIQQARENDLYSIALDSLFVRTEGYVNSFQPAPAIELLELTLSKGKHSNSEKNKIEERLLTYKEFLHNFENDGIISMLKDYRVKRGETLNGIAYRHKMQPTELLLLNKLKTSSLREGQYIKVKSNVKVSRHVVESGESLSVIASKYTMSLKELKNLNGFKTDVIQVGAVVKILHPLTKDEQKTLEVGIDSTKAQE